MLKQVVGVVTTVFEVRKADGGTVPPQLVRASYKFCLPNCFVLFQLLNQYRKVQLFGTISTFPRRDVLTAHRVPVVTVQRSNIIDWASVNYSQIFGH